MMTATHRDSTMLPSSSDCTKKSMTSTSEDDNKWAKNGFGENIPKSTAGGKFSKKESEQVRQAVMEYCAAKQIDVGRLCSECEHKAELKGAWMDIAKNLPHRSVSSVYRHGLRILHPFRRGSWSEEEVERLFDLVAQLGKKWVLIQKKMERSSDSCRDKYREMSKEFVKGRWKDEETQVLEQLIRDHLKAHSSASMLDIGRMVEAEGITLPWSTISRKMGSRSRLSCFKKFQKMAGLFVPSEGDDGTKKRKRKRKADVEEENDGLGDITGDVDMYLLTELVQTGATHRSEISWDTLRVGDALERFQTLVHDWQQQEGEEATDEALSNLSFSELAQLLLERKQSAKMAAETVEAVDLPEV